MLVTRSYGLDIHNIAAFDGGSRLSFGKLRGAVGIMHLADSIYQHWHILSRWCGQLAGAKKRDFLCGSDRCHHFVGDRFSQQALLAVTRGGLSLDSCHGVHGEMGGAGSKQLRGWRRSRSVELSAADHIDLGRATQPQTGTAHQIALNSNYEFPS